MISKAKTESIVSAVLDYANRKAHGTEVTVTASDVATSRFANNSMTQNQAPDQTVVSIRVQKNGRQARLSSDRLTMDSLHQLVDDALTACKYLERDADQLDLPAPSKSPLPKLNHFDEKTAELDGQVRAKCIKKIIDIAEKENLQAAGILSTGAVSTTIANSKGIWVSHRQSQAECSVTIYDGIATGWAKADYPSFKDLDYLALAERAAHKALSNRDPVEIWPGQYRVILEPSAVLDLVGFLAYDFTATSHLDHLSCFQNLVGKQVLGRNIQFWDDVTHPEQAGNPFDGEGVLRSRINLVENGILKNLVYGRRAALKMKAKATGHGLAEPCAEGEYPANLVIAGGSKSLQELIADEEKAILLTRVWYIREVDQRGKIVTGMTRDGSFLVENGKVKNAVKNLRFNQSLVDMLNNAPVLGRSSRTAGEEMNTAVVPPMVINNFNFSSTTTF